MAKEYKWRLKDIRECGAEEIKAHVYMCLLSSHAEREQSVNASFNNAIGSRQQIGRKQITTRKFNIETGDFD